ncbi:sensor histidine kinase [Dactylosporangium sp. CA-139066]|uniref:sensor histidine kinase n=1 Tax=Dactylosporangium sp. CA-139066 TaxID=3239930 RepID=UPI003D921EDE
MRAAWLLLLAVPVLCALPFTKAPGVPVSLAAMLAVAAAIRPGLRALPLAAALFSLAVTAAYTGAPQPPGLWFTFEFIPLLVLLVLTLRRHPAPALTGSLVALAATVLPLRITLHVPHNRLNGSVLLVATAFACVVAAAGVGLYLRWTDARRARVLADARRAQRLEVARDLHDLVAHEVTGIVVEAQAAQVAPDPRSYERIEAAGQRALTAMDDLVAALRSTDDGPRSYGLADLPGVVARFGASASLSVEPGVELSAAAGTAAYHVVIESLTNVRRHAGPSSRVSVLLTTAGVLIITNTGYNRNVGFIPRGAGDKSGLAGLAERVRTAGGTFEAGPFEGGWRVVADLSHSADVRPGPGQQP